MRQTIARLRRELGLTILLSSHRLNEVEQLCTRIAVLNQGRKVFEGLLEETRRRNHWVRLRVSDFAAAARVLTEADLISDHRADGRVALRDGADTDPLVRTLVERGVRVFEVVRETETLESFYLALMNGQKGAEPPSC
jgi:ABC-type multidrug transport system ATPase subunit